MTLGRDERGGKQEENCDNKLIVLFDNIFLSSPPKRPQMSKSGNLELHQDDDIGEDDAEGDHQAVVGDRKG